MKYFSLIIDLKVKQENKNNRVFSLNYYDGFNQKITPKMLKKG